MCISQADKLLLEITLRNHYIRHLPPLSSKNNNLTAEQKAKKNSSRALSAFTISNLCGIDPETAAKTVVDDFDDYGVDAIHFNKKDDTLYFLQTKYKDNEQFKQEEAQSFCFGIRKILNQDFTTFNEHFQKRQNEIEKAVEECSLIKVVVAYIGPGISTNAKGVMDDLFQDETLGEDRFDCHLNCFDSHEIKKALLNIHQRKKVNCKLRFQKFYKFDQQLNSISGITDLKPLAELYSKNQHALISDNIRSHLGLNTEVNREIAKTLKEHPELFVYLNNGITAICSHYDIKGKAASKNTRIVNILDLSIINGIQTIATASNVFSASTNKSLDYAKVHLTLLQCASRSEVCKKITYARNFQNRVNYFDFASLETIHEKLRKEAALLDVDYAYMSGHNDSSLSESFDFPLATEALSLFCNDPRLICWLKKDRSKVLSPSSEAYQLLFHCSLNAVFLVNAVRFYKYIKSRNQAEEKASFGKERIFYRHSTLALGWVLSKRINRESMDTIIESREFFENTFSQEYDEIRQAMLDFYSNWHNQNNYMIGALAFFRNQTITVPFLTDFLISFYGMKEDQVVSIKKNLAMGKESYPVDLYDYMLKKIELIGFT